ncbi:MAG: helix-turn-helix transcriptional regulator [Lachnospiraceae bacterium]|nr:helix-turn-helix transcriptional regulator [Lachnospiraceae bacterium]
MITYLSDNRTDFKAHKYLQVNSCGTEDIGDFSYAVVRDQGRFDYHVLYVKQGEMKLEIAGEITKLKEGESAFYAKGDRQFYIIPHDKDTVIYWLHFTGTSVEDVLASLSLTESRVIPIKSRTQFESLFSQLIHTHMLSTPTHEQEENTLLLQLLTQLFLACQKEPISNYREIYSTAEYIYDHFAEDLDLDQLAEKLHISKSHFAHLFKELVGCSPSNYQQKLRLDKARHYLLHTSQSVKEIAHAVGYSDALYFSRLFRKKYDISPKDFRKASGIAFENINA